MQQKAQFSKSKVPCLIRHRGGKYYASAKVAGKLVRRSFDTSSAQLQIVTIPEPSFGFLSAAGIGLALIPLPAKGLTSFTGFLIAPTVQQIALTAQEELLFESLPGWPCYLHPDELTISR